MTAQQPRTPLDDLVLRMHIHFGAANTVGDDYSADDFANVIRILENLADDVAAAEHRGAVRALREAAGVLQADIAISWNRHRGVMFMEDESDPGVTPEEWLKRRADRLEGSDE